LLRVSEGVYEFVVGEEILAVNGLIVVFFEVKRAGFQMNQIIILFVPSLTSQRYLTVFLSQIHGIMIFEAVENVLKVYSFTRNIQASSNNGNKVMNL
jgi:hypothetical protein